MDVSEPSLDVRRRRLKFRAWHRGMREVDLLLGRYADAHVADLDEAELSDFEGLLSANDRDLLGWITGETPIPPEDDSVALRRIITFHRTPSK